MNLEIGLREITRANYRKEKMNVHFKRFDKECWQDKEFCKIALKKYKMALSWVDPSFYEDEEMAAFMVKKYGRAIEKIKPDFLDNEEFMRDIIQSNIYHLKKASDRLKNDKDFILSIINLSPQVANVIGDQLKLDVNFIKDCIKRDGAILIQEDCINVSGLDVQEYVRNYDSLNEEEKRGVIKWLVLNEPQNVTNEMAKLIIDKENLKAVPLEKKMDKEIVLYAIKKDPRNIFFVPAELKKQRDVLLCMLEQESRVNLWGRFPEEFADDKLVVEKWMAAGRTQSFIINYEELSDNLKEDLDILKLLLELRPSSYHLVKEELRSNEEIMDIALRVEANFYHVPESKKSTVDDYIKLVNRNMYIMLLIPKEIVENRYFLEHTIKKDFSVFFIYFDIAKNKGMNEFCSEEDKEFLMSIADDIEKYKSEFGGGRGDLLGKYSSIIREYKLQDLMDKQSESKRVRRKI